MDPYTLVLQDLTIYGCVYIFLGKGCNVIIRNCTFINTGRGASLTIHFLEENMDSTAKHNTLAPQCKKKAKKARQDYNLSSVKGSNITATEILERYGQVYYNPPICTSSTASNLQWKVPCEQAKEKKDNTMAYENDLETSQRNHLKRRLESVLGKTIEDIQQKYLPDVEQPRTKDETLRKLAAGEYKLRDEAFTKSGDLRDWFSSRDSIEWTDPSKPRDQAGHDSAFEALTKAYVAAKDTAIVGTLPEGLKALQDFEAMTF